MARTPEESRLRVERGGAESFTLQTDQKDEAGAFKPPGSSVSGLFLCFFPFSGLFPSGPLNTGSFTCCFPKAGVGSKTSSWGRQLETSPVVFFCCLGPQLCDSVHYPINSATLCTRMDVPLLLLKMHSPETPSFCNLREFAGVFREICKVVASVVRGVSAVLFAGFANVTPKGANVDSDI